MYSLCACEYEAIAESIDPGQPEQTEQIGTYKQTNKQSNEVKDEKYLLN